MTYQTSNNNQTKNIMKKFSLFAVLLLILSACGDKKADGGDGVTAMNDGVRDSLREAVANQDSLIALMTEISEGMDQIKSLENILASTTNLTNETMDKRQKIRDDMAAIQRTLNERRQRLAELEERLSKSNANNANLKRAIATLKGQIAEQVTTIESLRKDLAAANIYIDQLTQSNDSLNTAVETTIQEKNEVLQENIDLTNELNICYYAIGSKSELKEHKIIETGFLKKTKIMPHDFEHNYFTVSDKRVLTTLPLHSKKAELMTNQPVDSYTITENADGMKVLNITDPQKFWATSNYLVIKVN